MDTGEVKFYNESKGFGFIIPDGGSDDLFFHVSGLADKEYKPHQKERVKFDVENGNRGLKAVNVEPIA